MSHAGYLNAANATIRMYRLNCSDAQQRFLARLLCCLTEESPEVVSLPLADRSGMMFEAIVNDSDRIGIKAKFLSDDDPRMITVDLVPEGAI